MSFQWVPVQMAAAIIITHIRSRGVTGGSVEYTPVVSTAEAWFWHIAVTKEISAGTLMR